MKRFLVPLLLLTILVLPINLTTQNQVTSETKTTLSIERVAAQPMISVTIATAEAAVSEYEDCCAQQHNGWCCALVRLGDWWEDFWNDGGSNWDW